MLLLVAKVDMLVAKVDTNVVLKTLGNWSNNWAASDNPSQSRIYFLGQVKPS